jgi:hypothetical protein
MYDGQLPGFNINRWWDPRYAIVGKLPAGSAVMIFFSVRAYNYNQHFGAFDGLTKAIGLGALALVLVGDRWPNAEASDYDHGGDGSSHGINVVKVCGSVKIMIHCCILYQ